MTQGPLETPSRGIRTYRRIVAIATVTAGLVLLVTASGQSADEPSASRFGQVNDYVDAYAEQNHAPGVAAAVIGPDGELSGNSPASITRQEQP